MSKSLVVSVSGKGGTGKTTLVALLLKVLLENENRNFRDILVVDADPDTNLPDVLGIEMRKTVGMVANELKKKVEKGQISPSVSKRDILEAWVYETLVEEDKFDMLVMGRTEGEGCYCYVNSVLTGILDVLLSNYDLILMDMEAGLEHISRRTDKDVDTMIVVVDPSVMSFKTAIRIKELVKEVHIQIKNLYLVGNRFSETLKEKFWELASNTGIDVAGLIPEDEKIHEYGITGRSLLELPQNSPSVLAAREVAKNIGLLT